MNFRQLKRVTILFEKYMWYLARTTHTPYLQENSIVIMYTFLTSNVDKNPHLVDKKGRLNGLYVPIFFKELKLSTMTKCLKSVKNYQPPIERKSCAERK